MCRNSSVFAYRLHSIRPIKCLKPSTMKRPHGFSRHQWPNNDGKYGVQVYIPCVAVTSSTWPHSALTMSTFNVSTTSGMTVILCPPRLLHFDMEHVVFVFFSFQWCGTKTIFLCSSLRTFSNGTAYASLHSSWHQWGNRRYWMSLTMSKENKVKSWTNRPYKVYWKFT